METPTNPPTRSATTSAPARGRGASPLAALGPAAAARLLPWSSPEGKPCHLVTDDPGSYLSRFADEVEATQLAVGRQVLADAGKVLADPMSPYSEVQYAGVRLAECLADALRVAESRGMRLSGAGGRSDGGTGSGDHHPGEPTAGRAAGHGDECGDRDGGVRPEGGPRVVAEGGGAPTVKEPRGR
ncbi:hypothetical protein [Streptomyces pacificus]|uniref:Uncharacterized protein n=1 Tax=Streptomyces pacificus TaxID=2705029 RepID=A0A6A0AWB7_9ACTN|nr:hypothetical protein [Streptomyces pacificus]GFH37196.1 hypothetical protein SCWH03_34320 [Streptomyces pacificus]